MAVWTLVSPEQPSSPARRGLIVTFAVVAVLVVVADQASKAAVMASLTFGHPVAVIPGWLQFRLLRNADAAFNLSFGATWVFTLISFVVSLVIIRASRRLGSRAWAVALGLMLGGAVGNLVDRLARDPGFGRGHVVDFIEYLRFPFMQFPVFNVADSCVVSAAVLLAILGVLDLPLAGRATPVVEQVETGSDV